ncbi:MAG: V-type ATP synthase subunit F [Candidatus Thorarchaeota archaeon]
MVNERIAVIGDRETVIGFRMAGVAETSVPTSSEDARRRLLNYSRDPSIGLIMITESMAQGLEDTILELSKAPLPVILVIPQSMGPKSAHEKVLRELVRRAVGVDINI